eukprot:200401-Prorocentrum_minimum.AAC.1
MPRPAMPDLRRTNALVSFASSSSRHWQETEQCFEIRRAQFQNAKDRCLVAAAEKESTRKKQKTHALLNQGAGGILGRSEFKMLQPKITGFTKSKQGGG